MEGEITQEELLSNRVTQRNNFDFFHAYHKLINFLLLFAFFFFLRFFYFIIIKCTTYQ